MYTNADQLKNKMTELEIRAGTLRPMIIGITEVKAKNPKGIQSSQEYSFETLNNYKMFSKNLETNVGRGLLLYVDTNLPCSEIEVDTSFEEFLAVRIQVSIHNTLLVLLVYRSDSGTTENNMELNRLIEIVQQVNHTHLLVMGDFNFPGIDWKELSTRGGNNVKEADFLETIMSTYLTQHVQAPTRSRGEAQANVLDLVFTNEERMIQNLQHEAPLGKSDHAVLNFNFVCSTELRERWITRYVYHKGDYEKFARRLGECDWDRLFADEDVNKAWQIFLEVMQKLMEDYIPKQRSNLNSKTRREFPLPPEIREKIKEKNRLSRKVFKKDGVTKETRKEYNRCRNKVQKLVKRARKDFERNLANQSKENPKVVWKYINAKAKTRAEIEELHVSPTDRDSATTKNDNEIAQILADYFKSVYCSENTSNIPTTPRLGVEHDDSELVTDEREMQKLLEELKCDKSPGPDGLHPAMLKKLAVPLSKPLAMLCNMTFRVAAVPDNWKQARICAIHKKGDPHLASNYRPVSLTPVISKLCEKIVRNGIMHHLTLNNLIADNQYGFLPGRNIPLQLLKVLDDWTEAWDEGLEIDCVYLDFSKAFDRVPHERLMVKLNAFGLHPKTAQWIRSFLTDRTQQVVVRQATSSPAAVTSGIPQGSVLGPLLFVMFINDLPGCVRNELYLFADDTKLYAKNDVPSLVKDLHNLQEWSTKWQLGFNAGKCKHMHIGRRNASSRLEMDGSILELVEEEKDLGVTFESSLVFKKHINEKTKKANSMFGIIRRSFRHLDVDTFLPLYKGMVRSHLDFAASVYSPALKADIDRIEAVQRRATKQLPGMKNLPYPDRLRKLKLPALTYRRTRSDMIELYKASSGIYKDQHCTFVKWQRRETSRLGNRGHQKKIFPTHSTSNIRKHAFCNRNATLWNSLPPHVVNAPSVNAFKARLDGHWKHQPALYDYTASIYPRMPPPVIPTTTERTPQEA
jgi:hypothetical protein